MISSIFTEINSVSSRNDVNYYSELEIYLEKYIDILISQHHLVKSQLINIMEIEQIKLTEKEEEEEHVIISETTSHNNNNNNIQGYSMGMTYLAAALILSGHGTESDNAKVILNIVENYLLNSKYNSYIQLRGHKCTLQRLEQVLEGYITILDAQQNVKNKNYQRKLYYLHLAIINLRPDKTFLTIAHPLFIREARINFFPNPALIIMREPILEISPDKTGAGLLCFYQYYFESGMLLVHLNKWKEAVGWFRFTLPFSKRISRPITFDNIISSTITITNNNNNENNSNMINILLKATKVFILVSIIAYGDFNTSGDRKRAQRILQQFRGNNNNNNIEPYLRLLSAALLRDGKMFEMIENHFESVWKEDEMLTLVIEAKRRLCYHVIRDLAKVANRVYLSNIISEFQNHSLICNSNNNNSNNNEEANVVQLLLSMQEEGELLVSLESITLMETNNNNNNNNNNNVSDVGKESEEKEIMKQNENKKKVLAVRLAIPQLSIPSQLGENTHNKSETLFLGITDKSNNNYNYYIEIIQKYQQLQLCHAMEERIQRSHNVHFAIMQKMVENINNEKDTGEKVQEENEEYDDNNNHRDDDDDDNDNDGGGEYEEYDDEYL